jgi:hypothetical protein
MDLNVLRVARFFTRTDFCILDCGHQRVVIAQMSMKPIIMHTPPQCDANFDPTRHLS